MKTQSTPPLAAVAQPRLVRGFSITDRFTGHKPSGEFGLGDDMDEDRACPVCGAEIGQQCSEEDPDDKGRGIELGQYVHIERLSSANSGIRSVSGSDIRRKLLAEVGPQILDLTRFFLRRVGISGGLERVGGGWRAGVDITGPSDATPGRDLKNVFNRTFSV